MDKYNMNNKLTPEQHFITIHKAKIENTGKKAYKVDAWQQYQNFNQPYLPMDTVAEDVIGIYLNESEYHRFMANYEQFLHLIYGIQDPIARDMFEKLMMYIELKR
jgi:hypothetical protein